MKNKFLGVDWGPSKVLREVPVEFWDFKDVFEPTFPVVDPGPVNPVNTSILFFSKHMGRFCDDRQCNLTLLTQFHYAVKFKNF